MKSLVFAIASFMLVACVASPKDPREPVRASVPARNSSAQGDLPPPTGKEVDMQRFLQQCVSQTGMNFTYDGATAKVLERSYVQWSNQSRLSGAEFEEMLGALLSSLGLDMKPIGPAQLRVFSISQRPR